MFSWWFKPCPVSWARLVSRPAVLMAGPPRPGVISQLPTRKRLPAPPCRLPRRFLYQGDRGVHCHFGTTERQAVACGSTPASETAHSPHSPGTKASSLCLDRKAVLASANGSAHPPSCGSVSRLSIISTLGSESLPGSVEGFSGPSSSMAAELCVPGLPSWRQGAQYTCSMMT